MIAIGVATSGSGSGVSARLERYASAKQTGKPDGAGQGGIADLLQQSVALAQLNRVVEGRDFGANLARDLARADLRLKPSEFLMIWAGAVIGIPVVMYAVSPFLPTLGSPLFLLIGALLGFFLPRLWLGRRKS